MQLDLITFIDLISGLHKADDRYIAGSLDDGHLRRIAALPLRSQTHAGKTAVKSRSGVKCFAKRLVDAIGFDGYRNRPGRALRAVWRKAHGLIGERGIVAGCGRRAVGGIHMQAGLALQIAMQQLQR